MAGWLDREQDKAPRAEKKQKQAKSKNSFNNFHQREYDWDDITMKIIEAHNREMKETKEISC